jgi:dTDP-4-dehydrorhamnose 3,5-epimerase
MQLDIRPLDLPGLTLIRSARSGDRRGYFAETYVQRDFAAAGIPQVFVQDNQSRSAAAGTVRGLHFQSPPMAQAKLIRVLRGKILDVVVDLRRASPGYGRHLTVELDAESGEQLFIPAGFAHGFCTLTADAEIFYKVDQVYSPQHDCGIHWADPDLGIRWPVAPAAAVLSQRDAALPRLRDVTDAFA